MSDKPTSPPPTKEFVDGRRAACGKLGGPPISLIDLWQPWPNSPIFDFKVVRPDGSALAHQEALLLNTLSMSRVVRFRQQLEGADWRSLSGCKGWLANNLYKLVMTDAENTIPPVYCVGVCGGDGICCKGRDRTASVRQGDPKVLPLVIRHVVCCLRAPMCLRHDQFVVPDTELVTSQKLPPTLLGTGHVAPWCTLCIAGTWESTYHQTLTLAADQGVEAPANQRIGRADAA